LTKEVRTTAAIYEQMHVIEFAIGRPRELTGDYPLSVRIEVNNIQEECVDLLRYKLHELRRAGIRAGLLAKKTSDPEQQPYLVPLIQSEEMP